MVLAAAVATAMAAWFLHVVGLRYKFMGKQRNLPRKKARSSWDARSFITMLAQFERESPLKRPKEWRDVF